MPGTPCAYRPCSSRTGQEATLFSFPKDYESAKTWAVACNRRDILIKNISSFRLCEHHFEEKYFSSSVTSRKRLLPNAIPTLFLGVPKRTMKEDTAGKIEGSKEGPPKKIVVLSDITLPPEQPPTAESTKPASLVFSQSADDVLNAPSTSKSIQIAPLDISELVGDQRPISPPLLSPTSTQTPPYLSSRTPRKEKLRSKIKILQKTASREVGRKEEEKWTIADFNKLCDLFISQPFADIVKTHAALKNKKPLARRYSSEMKQFALTLYFLSPKAYQYLSKLMTLPNKRTLQRLTQEISYNPGINNSSLFKALGMKIRTLQDKETHCILCIDEMSIKSNLFYDTGRDEIIGFEDIGKEKNDSQLCKNVLVIMARGLFSPWKQAIAYFFVGSQFKAGKLRPVLEECVLKLTEIGLKVEGIASDMGSNFIELARSFGVSPQTPEFNVGDQKLLYIFDPCHLIKATRNNLLKHSFCFNGKRTSWSFIENFYNQDKKQFYRCAPKLTTAHLHPSNFEKMRVSLATQVLSHSVASGMNTYMSLGALPNEAFGTIEVVEKFNNLFDILNSYSLNDPNKFKNVYEGSAFQKEFLNDILEFLNELKVVDNKGQDITNRVKFHKCWAVTINSVLILWERLSKCDYKYLKTRRLNTDCLENYFGSIRQQGGNSVNPTPIQFRRTFRKLFVQSYFHSNDANCKDDFDEVLMNLKSTNIAEVVDLEPQLEKPSKALSLPDYDYRKETTPTKNAFSYVCGYLIKKCLDVHSCSTCYAFGTACKTLNVDNLLAHFKAFDTDKGIFGGLLSPPEEFLSFIYKLENIFNSQFEKICTGERISHYLFNLFEEIDFVHPCTEFPKKYLLKLFIRMKIFYTIKYTNRDLKTSSDKKTVRKIKFLSHL